MWNVTSPHIFDIYDKSKVPENLYIWYEVWDNMFDSENNHYYYRFEPTNIRLALKEIVSDLYIANEQNKNIRKQIKFLEDKFYYAKRIDFISTEIFPSEIKKYEELLKRGYNNNSIGFSNDIITFSNFILNKFDEGIYFYYLFDILFNIVFKEKNPSLKKLQLLSNFLVIELISKGFSLATVKDIPNNIFNKNLFSNLKDNNDSKYLHTNLICTLDDNASFEDRLNFIKSIYEAPEFECDILLLVLGIKEEDANNIKIGEVEFINKLKIEFPENNNKDEKLFVFNFQEKEMENSPFIRAKVRRKGIDLFEIMHDAFEITVKTIDFLKYRYTSNKRENIKLSRGWAALDINGNLIHQVPDISFDMPERYESNKVLSEYFDSVKITEQQGKEYGLGFSTLESNKIHIALEWISKARKEDYSLDNYFMNMWIALEYLIKEKNKTTIESIMNNIPFLLANFFLKGILDNLHHIHHMQLHLRKMKIKDIGLAKKIGLYPIDNENTFKWHPIE